MDDDDDDRENLAGFPVIFMPKFETLKSIQVVSVIE